MFNVPLQLRTQKDFITPKGPDFSGARSFQTEILGTGISFKAPKHQPRRTSTPIIPQKTYKNLHLRSYYNEQDAEKNLIDRWKKAQLFYHGWAFYGSWFTGVLSELRMHFNLISPINYPENISLFHPRTFEQVVGDYLTDKYGHQLDFTRDHIQEHNAPIDWQPLEHLPTHAVTLKVIPQESSTLATIDHWLFITLADNMMAAILFVPSRLKALPRSELDKHVDEQPMLDLMDEIISSIEIKLSPQAKAQQHKATEGLEDASLITYFPPLKWDKHGVNEISNKYIEEARK